MNTNVRVSSLYAAQRFANRWAHQVVSVLNPDIGQRIIPQSHTLGVSADNHLLVYFDDIDNPPSNGRNIRVPMDGQIRDIFAFCRPDANVLVHCHGGVSRSPAIAICLLVHRGVNVIEALRIVMSQDQDGFMFPSLSLLDQMDRVMGLGGSLRETVALNI